MSLSHRGWYSKGLRDGIPIGLGYFAVALAIGIAARNAGLTAPQATITSLLIHASAGEYIGITLMAARAGLLEIVLVPVLVWTGLDIPLFGIDGMLCKMIVTPIVILLNYTCGKWLVFRKK